MGISIRIISSPEGESITNWHFDLPDAGGVIGRGYGANVELRDASKIISSTHAVIKRVNRAYQIEDKSSNGVFINGAKSPLGKGNQATLNDGDVLDVGNYRLQVSCFIPSEAIAQSYDAVNQRAVFGDDPFSQQDILHSSNQAVMTENAKASYFSDEEKKFIDTEQSLFWESDPFLSTKIQKTEKNPQLDLNFDIIDVTEKEEDPFKGDAFKFELMPLPKDKPKTQECYVETVTLFDTELDVLFKKQVTTAMDNALNRLLQEFAPEELETLFNEFIKPKWYQQKPNYWLLYKNFFARQMQNKDWQVKFQAYFQESLDELQSSKRDN